MISVVLHFGPGLADYSLQLANALSEVARVGLSLPIDMQARYGNALSSSVTPLVFHRPRRRNLWGFSEMYRHSRAIQEFQPDLFHLQADGVWESVLLRMIAPLPVINTIHDPIKHIDQRNWLNDFLMADAVHRASGWVVHSEAMKSIFLKRFQVNPDRVLIHCLGKDNYYTRFAPGKIHRKKNILFFGSLRYNKGVDILLKAFESVKRDLDGWKLVIAGEGDGLKNFQSLKNSLGEQLELHEGVIPDDETAELFSQAGIVVLPYRHGTQSGVLAIAASFACPVLSTPFGGMVELVKDRRHVLFVEPESETALAQGLLELIHNESLRLELGQNLKELSAKEWSWDQIAQKTTQFYLQILS